MTPIRTGDVVTIDGEPNLVITRTFGSPAEAVWQTMIDTHWLRQWIGHWEGDPTTGHVSFFMTAESPDPEPQRFTILECDRPRRFAGITGEDAAAWNLWFELDEVAAVTTLTFGQRLAPGDDLGSIGPGWEYYLDRAHEVHEGRDAGAVVWDDYYPALRDEYAALAPQPGA